MAKKGKLTPMMQQYMQIKEENKDCILFYRLGDFYEMFFDDALTASKELVIARYIFGVIFTVFLRELY